jgi:hypothetical protein
MVRWWWRLVAAGTTRWRTGAVTNSTTNRAASRALARPGAPSTNRLKVDLRAPLNPPDVAVVIDEQPTLVVEPPIDLGDLVEFTYVPADCVAERFVYCFKRFHSILRSNKAHPFLAVCRLYDLVSSL